MPAKSTILCALPFLLVLACASGDFSGTAKKSDAKPATNGPGGGKDSPDDLPDDGEGKNGAKTGSKSGAKDGSKDGAKSGSKSGSKDGDEPELGTVTDDEGWDDDSEIFTEDDTIHRPKTCNAADMVLVPVGKECPRNFALYTMDDMGSKDQVPSTYVCCALPARDILTKKKDRLFQKRSRRCNANEVMVGAADQSGTIFCSEINTDKYELKSAKLVCAGKRGGAFGIGAQDCGGSAEIVAKSSLPSNISALVIGPLGEDGCVTVPYGSLVIQQGGRKCENSAASTLIYKSSGQAVKMFP